jgi:hypothetical protein
VRDPINSPFRTLAYFQGVRACQGYYPRYHPGFVSFDPQGKPYLQYGAGIIQTLGPDGKWQVRNLLTEVVEPYAREEMGYKSLEPGDNGAGNETAIRWDRGIAMAGRTCWSTSARRTRTGVAERPCCCTRRTE